MMLGKYSHSNPPKKEQRASRVRLDWCNRVPTLQDIRLLASEAFNTKGLLVELPIRTPAGVFLLSCQRDNLSPAPCWTLYEGEDGAKQLWSYLDDNVDMISDITGMSVMPKDAKTHVDLPKPDLASLINQEAAAAAPASPAAAPAAAPAPTPAAAPMPAAPMPAAPLPPPAPFADPTAWAPQNTASGTPWGATPAADWAAMPQQAAPQQDWTQAPQPAAQPGWNQTPQAAPGWPQQAAPAANPWPAQAPPAQPGWNQAPPAQEPSPWNQQPPTQPAGWPQQAMPQQAAPQGGWPAQAMPAQQASPWGAAAAAPAAQQANPWNSAPAGPASTGNAAADFIASLSNRENVTIAELSMDPKLPGNCVDAVLKLQEMVLTGHFTDRVAVAAIKLVAQNNGVLDDSILQKAKSQAGTDPTELARQGAAMLQQAGLLTEQDLFKAESTMGSMKNNYADALVSSCANKIDKLILEAAQECHLMVSQNRLRIDQAMIALHYCTRSRVRLKDALEELSIDVV